MPRDCNYQRDRGERQKCRILAVVDAEPLTAKEIAEAIHLTLSGALLHIKDLMEESPRRLHVAGHVPNSEGRPAPKYGAGDMSDAVYQPIRKPKLPDRAEVRRTAVLVALKESPLTAEQLGQKLNLSVSRARFYVQELREQGLAYIKSWLPPHGRGDRAPVYALGHKPDAPKRQQTRAETYRKEVSDPDKHERLLAKRRARYNVQKHTRNKQGIFAALGL